MRLRRLPLKEAPPADQQSWIRGGPWLAPRHASRPVGDRALTAAPPSRAQEIIRAKREGAALDGAQIDAFVRGLVSRSWSEGQVAALAMAICLRGMTHAETTLLTRAMAASGQRLDWSRESWPGPLLD